MHWLCAKSGGQRAAFPHEASQAKPGNCQWSGLQDHTQDFGLKLDSSQTIRVGLEEGRDKGGHWRELIFANSSKAGVKWGLCTVSWTNKAPSRANIQEWEPGSPKEVESRSSGKWDKHMDWEAQMKMSKVTFMDRFGHSDHWLPRSVWFLVSNTLTLWSETHSDACEGCRAQHHWQAGCLLFCSNAWSPYHTFWARNTRQRFQIQQRREAGPGRKGEWKSYLTMDWAMSPGSSVFNFKSTV